MEEKIKKPGKNSWTNKDNPGSFLMISKNELYVDHSYQRDARDTRVNTIAKNWDWVKFGAISVSMRPDSSFYIIDGQHRHQAAMRRDDVDMLPCMVFEMSETTDEARGFLDINTMVGPPSMVEKFRVMVKLNDPGAVKLQRLADECGRKIDRQASANSIACIARLLYHMRYYPDALDRVWSVLLEVCEGEVFNNRIVEGIVWLEHNLPEGKSLAHPTYKRILCSIGYKALLKQIQDTIKYEDQSGMAIWGQGILKALNKRLRNRLELNT